MGHEFQKQSGIEPSLTASAVMEKFRRRIIELRKQRKWTQGELATRSGIKLSTYQYYEATGKISFQRLLRIFETLNKLSDFDDVLSKMESSYFVFEPSAALTFKPASSLPMVNAGPPTTDGKKKKGTGSP